MPGNYLQTLGRGLEVLEALKDGPRSVTDLAAVLQLKRSAAYRIARTLEHHRFVTRDDNGTYRLGLAVWELGARTKGVNDVRASASQQIDELVARFGETAHLSVYDRGEVVYVDRMEGTHPIGSYTRLGGRAPAYCVATGKALLALQPDHEIERVIAEGLAAHTPATITDADELRRTLADIAHGAVAINRGEWRADVGGIAVPILGAGGEAIAAIGLSGPVERILARQDEMADALRDAAAGIHR